MKIIDAHNHPDWHGHDFSRFIRNMDEQGIAKTWLLTWECPPDEYDPSFNAVSSSCLVNDGTGPIPFSRCYDYATRAPDRFVLGYGPDPRLPGSLDKLKAGVEIYGVRVCGELKLRMMCDNRDAIRMYCYCGEKGLPVIIHFDYEINKDAVGYPRGNYWYGGGIEAFERVLKECPETVFLGHAPGFWAHISNDQMHDRVTYPKGKVVPGGMLPELLREYSNLYCDLSAGSGLGALQRDPDFALQFLLEFQDRLLFARDCFDDRHYRFLTDLNLPEEPARAIFYGNAQRLESGGRGTVTE